MDFTLRCNSLKCRTRLDERAVVTTCSHIFCLRCSEASGLANTASSQRTCPACATILSNLDDVVSTVLSPTEDYKTSVLSGLSPAVIMECASRALAFWSYQSSQEVIYQEYLVKSLKDKYGSLSVQLDRIINDANAEIENLTRKVNVMRIEQDRARTENVNLTNTLKEKSRKQQQVQELYDRLKHRQMAAATQSAALDSADEMLSAAQIHGEMAAPMRHTPRKQHLNRASANFDTQPSTLSDVLGTPHHRQRLGASAYGTDASLRQAAHLNSFQTFQNNSFRHPLANSHNTQTHQDSNAAFGIGTSTRKRSSQTPRPVRLENAFDDAFA